MEEIFKCLGCGCELPLEFSLRTKNYCYLCDPNITLHELLDDKPIEKCTCTLEENWNCHNCLN